MRDRNTSDKPDDRRLEAARARTNAGELSAQRTIDVPTGCVALASSPAWLRSTPLGSCVAVVLLDSIRPVGAMAHVMLPGQARGHVKGTDRMRYAADAIDWLVDEMCASGSTLAHLRAGLIGGANVLQRPDAPVCSANVESVSRQMQRHGIRIVARDLGGCLRRRAIVSIEQRSIASSCGDGMPVLLWPTEQTHLCPGLERDLFEAADVH